MKKTKRFLVGLLCALSACFGVFALSACENDGVINSSQTPPTSVESSLPDGSVQNVQWTVTYDANGGAFENGEATFAQTVSANALLTAPTSPKRTDYTFAGWATDKNGENAWAFDSDKPTSNVTLYAMWKMQGGKILSVENATLEGEKIFMLVDHTQEIVSLSNKVVCSGDSTWKLYYDRLGQMEIPTKIAAGAQGVLNNGDNVFYIVASSSDGTQVNVYELNVYKSFAVSVSFLHGEKLLKTETAYTGYEYTTDYKPSITGYTFNDWNYSPKVLWEPLILHADATANTYTVTYDVNGGDALSTTEKKVTFDNNYTLAKPKRTGYTFLGWYVGSKQLTNNNGSSLNAWEYDTDKTLTAKWQVNDYAVTLNRNDERAGTVSGAGSYAYDNNVTITASTKSGYTWLGWYDDEDQLVTRASSYSFKMGFAVAYTAKWCKITLNVSDGNAGSVSSVTETHDGGVEVRIAAKTNDGYTWLGWYNGETKLTDKLSYTFIAGENVTYTAKWTYYTVTTNTNLSGAGTYTSYTNKKVTVGTEITLTATTYNGYTWVGWYDGETKLTDELSYTFAMPVENVKYTAKWKVAEEMQNFVFTSTETSCSITGIQDKTVTEIVVPDYVTSISIGAFKGCSVLESITLPFVGGSRKTLSDYYQYPLGYIFGTTSYTGATACEQYYHGASIGSYTSTTFYIPTSLRTVTFTGEKILSYAFNACSNLTSVIISDSVTWIGSDAFRDCKNLTSVIIPDGVTRIEYATFSGCSSLTSIEIPDSVTRVGDYAFNSCASLTSVIIGESVMSIGDSVFSGCSSLTSIMVSADNTAYQSIDGNLYAKDGKTLVQYAIGKTATSFTVPDSVTSIGDWAFYGCGSLKSVAIPHSVTNIGNSAFRGCSSLTNITIPDSVSSIGVQAFEYCASLTSVVIPGSVTSIGGYTFYCCDNLTSVAIGDGVTSIGRYAFQYCRSLTNITIPDSVSSIGVQAFYYCSSLTSVTIGDGVTNMGDYAFSDCNSLTSVVMGDGVTSIGYRTFGACSSLTSMEIPNNVTNIGDYAFAGCSNLTIYCEAESQPSGWGSKWNSSNCPVVWGYTA